MSSQENATPLTSPETTPASPIAADTDTSAAQQQPDKEDAEEKITDDGKVTLFFKHVGNAPILKKKKYKISADSSFQEVIKFIKIRLLKLKPTDSLVWNKILYIYVLVFVL